MSISNSAENNMLKLLFQNTAWANIGDAGGLQPSATAGSLFVSLHTGDPGEAGTQTTSEAAYTSYARVGVARSGAGWAVTNNVADNVAAITFPIAGSTSPETETYTGIGRATSGTGELIFSGAVTSPPAGLSVDDGIEPEFAIGVLDATLD